MKTSLTRRDCGSLVIVAALAIVSAGRAEETILVAPMLTTQWSQWNHFNEQAPTDPLPGSGYDGKAPVGCMPVAGSQIAKYHVWPPRGSSSHNDHDGNSENLISGSFPAAFGDKLNWSEMQDSYNPWSSEPRAAVDAVSAVMYKMGVVFNLDFGSFESGGSQCSLQSLSRGMNRCFFYERGTYMVRAGNEANFDSNLRANILASQPVVVAVPGHSAVVDGLKVVDSVDYYHFNYGLGGQDDGWYQTSAVARGPLEAAIFGQRPSLIPILSEAGFTTNVTGNIDLSWSVAQSRLPEVTKFRVLESAFNYMSYHDNCNNMKNWVDYSGSWSLESPGYLGSGQCIRIDGEIGDFTLVFRDPFKPSTNTDFTFRRKAILVDDHVYVEYSANRGKSWSQLRHYTNTGWDTTWYLETIDLGGFAGQEIMIRIRYTFPRGTYYGINGGFWFDFIDINDFDWLRYSVLQDDISASATNYNVGVQLEGTRHFQVEAYNGSDWTMASPFVTVTVELDPNLDVDGDGLANGWETTHYGSATGAVADADSDGDGTDSRDEFVAGTDPSDADSLFEVTDSQLTARTPNVSWSSVGGKFYTVWRATNFIDGFTAIATDIAATPPANTYTDTEATGLGSVFYSIGVEE